MMEERKRVLEQLEAGEIGVEEAVQRMEEIQAPPALPGDAVEAAESVTIGEDGPEQGADVSLPRPLLVRIVWQATLWLGVLLLVGGALLVAAVYAWDVAGGWLVCGWPLLGLGIVGVALAWWMRGARWFSLRVKEKDGTRIAFALPMPLGLIGWGLRLVRPFVPQVKEMGLDEMVMALHEQVQAGEPLSIKVDEGPDGDQVEIYFG